MSNDEIIASILATLVAGLLFLLPVLFRLAARLVEKVGDAWIDKIGDDRTRTRVELAKGEILTAVGMVGQTLAPEYRAAAADGKITEEERAHLRQTALTEAKRRFGPSFWTDLMKRLELPPSEQDAWILAQVEAYVFQSKQPPSPPNGNSAGSPGGS